MDGQLQDPIKVGLQERPAGTAVQGPCQHKIAAQYNISGVSYEVYTEDWPQDSIKPGLQEGPPGTMVQDPCQHGSALVQGMVSTQRLVCTAVAVPAENNHPVLLTDLAGWAWFGVV